MIERDWLRVGAEDARVFTACLAEIGRTRKEDAMSVLANEIIRLAEGGDVSPSMRAHIAWELGPWNTGMTRLVLCQKGRGNRANPSRDAVIAAMFQHNLPKAGGKREAAYQAVANMFRVTPRAVKQALRRHEQKESGQEIKSE
jgi:hypothetical protein